MTEIINLRAKNGREFQLRLAQFRTGAAYAVAVADEVFVGWLAFVDVTGDRIQRELRKRDLELAGDQLALALVGFLKLALEE